MAGPSDPAHGPGSAPAPDQPANLPGQHWCDTALALPSEQVSQYVAATRRAHPDAGPAELIDIFTRTYRRIVSGSGAAFGAAAAGRGVGPIAALGLTAGTLSTFVAASGLYCLAVAQVHGVAVHDLPRRRELVSTVLLGRGRHGVGPDGVCPGRDRVLQERLHLSAPTWASVPRRRVPAAQVRTVSRRLRRRTAVAALGGSALTLSRALPYGVGAALGARSAQAMATAFCDAVADRLGPPPQTFPEENAEHTITPAHLRPE